MSAGPVMASEELVSEADYVQLCRLVTEHAWRTDNGRADTLHELWADDGELDLGSTTLWGRESHRRVRAAASVDPRGGSHGNY